MLLDIYNLLFECFFLLILLKSFEDGLVTFHNYYLFLMLYRQLWQTIVWFVIEHCNVYGTLIVVVLSTLKVYAFFLEL
jgi:hypothetical protein